MKPAEAGALIICNFAPKQDRKISKLPRTAVKGKAHRIDSRMNDAGLFKFKFVCGGQGGGVTIEPEWLTASDPCPICCPEAFR